MRAVAAAVFVLLCCIAAGQGPWLGGQREIVLGPQSQPEQVLGLYVNRNTGTSIGDIVNKTFIELRLGWMGWKVKGGEFGGKPCTVLDTDAYTTVTQKAEGSTRVLTSTVKVARQTYLDPKTGKILRETYLWQDPRGTFKGEAIFGNDEVELEVTGPGVNRKITVFPDGGTAMLDAMYKPMVVDGKTVLTEKEFTVMNPLTGGVFKVKARMAGRFDWTSLKRKGSVIEIVWPDHTQKAFLDEKGELLKVDLPQGRYLLLENMKKS